MSSAAVYLLLTVSVSQPAGLPCGRADFAVATPGGVLIRLEHGGARASATGAGPAFIRCAGNLVDHPEVGERLMILDSRARAFCLEGKVIEEPLVRVQEGTRLLPGRGNGRFWVVCPEFRYRISLVSGHVSPLLEDYT